MSSNESENDHKPQKKTSNILNYKRNFIRQSKVKDVKHTNWSGKLLQSRKTGQNCT
jgi:hypothetical protein